MNPSLSITRKTAILQLREIIPVCDEKELMDMRAELKRLLAELEKKRDRMKK